jgi:hypothetical protein
MSDWLDKITEVVQQNNAAKHTAEDAYVEAERKARQDFEISRDHLSNVVEPVLAEVVAHLNGLGRPAQVIPSTHMDTALDDAFTYRVVLDPGHNRRAELMFGTDKATGMIHISAKLPGVPMPDEWVTVEELTADAVRARVSRFVVGVISAAVSHPRVDPRLA